MKNISKIEIRHLLDETPDLSFLGQYADQWQEGAIERENAGSREYKYFIPANNECAQQDYERMEAYNDEHWNMMGIRAQAEIHTSTNGTDWLINRISSGGLWGIESDSDKSYLATIARDEMSELKTTLLELGFSETEIEMAFQRVVYP